MKLNHDFGWDDLQYQAVPLPEDILKLKWSGRFDDARKAIRIRLSQPGLPHAQQARLAVELKNLDHMEARYSLADADVLPMIQTKLPDFTQEDVEQLILEGRLEWIFRDGARWFMPNTVSNFFRNSPEYWPHMEGGDPRSSFSDEIFDGLQHGDSMHAHIHLRHDFSVKPEAFQQGKTLKLHLPLPLQRQQIHDLKVHAVSPAPVRMPEDGDIQPTVYFEGVYPQEQVFSVEYSFENITPYVDLSQVNPEDVAAALERDGLPEDAREHLGELAPHILFTPYLKALAEELRGEETNPLLIARRFYDYITTHLVYTYVRDYASLDSIAELMAINGKGDCGMQGILFITLCRICGIPARWQSGLYAGPNDIGEHDWAEFYVPSVGWVYCDPSLGRFAKIRNQEFRWNFYFGNIEPYRVPTNCGFQAEFNPPGQFLRRDTVDNQTGEAEYEDRPLYTGFSYDYFDQGIRLMPHIKGE